MKLNGWQRIGVVLSLAWISGAFYSAFDDRNEVTDPAILAQLNTTTPVPSATPSPPIPNDLVPVSPPPAQNNAVVPQSASMPQDTEFEDVTPSKVAPTQKNVLMPQQRNQPAQPDLSKYSDAELLAAAGLPKSNATQNNPPFNPDDWEVVSPPPYHWISQAMRNSVPVPITWFVVYCVVWIFRWVKAGFVQRKT